MKVLEAAIFDLDGVITSTSTLHFKAWKKLAKEIGIKLPRGFNEKLTGVSRMESLDLILQFGEGEYSNPEKSILADKKNNYYLNYVKAITNANLFPGVLECFGLLNNKGIKIVLASASNNANLVIKLLNIENYFVQQEILLMNYLFQQVSLQWCKKHNLFLHHCMKVYYLFSI